MAKAFHLHMERLEAPAFDRAVRAGRHSAINFD